jgi:hypothetical protein
MTGEEDIQKTLGVVLADIGHIRTDVIEIKQTGKDLNERGLQFERQIIKDCAKLTQNTDASHKRIDYQSTEINNIKIELFALTKETRQALLALTTAMQPLLTMSRVVIWGGGIVGGAILLLLIGIFTGQVTLGFN